MRLNQNTKLIGNKVIFIPYEKEHVLKYHMWMKSKELQDLTASEPLSLDEEYNMQRSWREDEDKCTFIILHKGKNQETNNEIDSMIGDTNIFIIDKESAVGEIEIMIAENWARGHKLGWEAVILMLLYGIQYIGLKVYQAKISLKNTVSIQMFRKLGFVEKSISEIFNEITLEKQVTDVWVKWLNDQYNFEMVVYRD